MAAHVEMKSCVSADNCRETRSHKGAPEPACQVYTDMLARGKAGEPLWNPLYAAKLCTLEQWSIATGRTMTDLQDGNVDAQWAFIAGNCRFKTIQDAIDELTAQKVELSPEQLLIPYTNLTGMVHTRFDILRLQTKDNTEANQAHEVTGQERLKLALELEKEDYPLEGPELKRYLGFDRHWQQRVCYAARIWSLVPSFKERLLACTEKDKSKRSKIQWSPDCEVPIERIPYNKLNSLYMETQNDDEPSKAKKALATIAKDVEELLSKTLVKGGSKAAETFTASRWKQAAKNCKCKDGLIAMFSQCVQDNSLEKSRTELAEIINDSCADLIRWRNIGRKEEERLELEAKRAEEMRKVRDKQEKVVFSSPDPENGKRCKAVEAKRKRQSKAQK